MGKGDRIGLERVQRLDKNLRNRQAKHQDRNWGDQDKAR